MTASRDAHEPMMSDLLAAAVLAEVRATDRVLDIGTGSGVNAILAAAQSSHVIAVDVNPAAFRWFAPRDLRERATADETTQRSPRSFARSPAT